MSGVRFSKVIMVAIAAVLSVAAHASAEDISAKRISIKDNADPAKRKVQVQSADLGVQFAEADDPATKGAKIHVYSATDNLCVSLPAGIEWESKNSVWKYKNTTTKNQAQIGDGKLKVKIRSGVSYTLADDGSQGPVNVQLQFGDGTRYCLRCSTPTRNDDKTYSAKECAAVPCDTEPPSDCTPAVPPATRCGDGNVDAGEDCELDADCALGATCTDWCFCIDAQCPEAIEWTSNAGPGTTTELDLGTAGFLHDAEVDDSTRLVLAVSDFSGAAPSCGVATIGGVNPREGNCRCASDTRIICDEPFVADQDDCGGAVCDCYLAPPQPVSAGGSPACLLQRLAADVTGTWNVDTGSAQLTVPQRTKVYLGIDNVTPCPTCVGDVVANDGVRDGTCVGGQNDPLSCDANGSDATFPAPGGGSYSYDCMPANGFNVAGPGITSDHVLTTGSASLPLPQLACDNGFDLCTCRVCSGDSSLPCSSDTDCTAAGAGTCTGGGNSLRANFCVDDTCTPDGGGEGTCNSGPDFSYCDGIVRANGEGLWACNSNADCEPLIPGTGNCTIVELQKCFLDAIAESGSASTSDPVLASTYCVAGSSNAGFNNLVGLPGPAKARLEVTTVFPCAGTPGSDYPGCP